MEDFKEYYDEVYNFILAKTKYDKAFADDVFQDTIEKVIKLKDDKYTEMGAAKSWMMMIAKNLIIDRYRAKSRNRTVELDEDTLSEMVEEEPSEEIDKEKLNKAIDSLNKDFKEVVVLYYFNGLSFREIAEYKGISINTVLGRMLYAKKRIKKYLLWEN